MKEFTTVLDDRTLPLTVGYFVELQGSLGVSAHLQRVRCSLLNPSYDRAERTSSPAKIV